MLLLRWTIILYLENYRASFKDTNLYLGLKIPDLPSSEKEVICIYEQFKKKDQSSAVCLYVDANEQSFRRIKLSDFKYIHIASHGLVNEEQPDQSFLLFAPPLNPADSLKGSGADEFLTLYEIYNLKLNADLVVLSACQTGRGRYKAGEGVIGLTRSLFYAGARNVIVSQWKVSDLSTSLLMQTFYRNRLDTMPFAQALQAAKLELLKHPHYAVPYHWAPFVLIGFE